MNVILNVRLNKLIDKYTYESAVTVVNALWNGNNWSSPADYGACNRRSNITIYVVPWEAPCAFKRGI